MRFDRFWIPLLIGYEVSDLPSLYLNFVQESTQNSLIDNPNHKLLNIHAKNCIKKPVAFRINSEFELIFQMKKYEFYYYFEERQQNKS